MDHNDFIIDCIEENQTVDQKEKNREKFRRKREHHQFEKKMAKRFGAFHGYVSTELCTKRFYKSNVSKRYAKSRRAANRAVRRYKNRIASGSSYKKIYDYQYEVD